MIVTLDAKHRLSIPVAFAHLQPGDRFDVKFDAEENAVILRRIASGKSWLDVIKRCPAPMDDLPPRSREFAKKS